MALLQHFFWRFMKDRRIFFYDHFNHSIAKFWNVLERAILYSKTVILILFQIEPVGILSPLLGVLVYNVMSCLLLYVHEHVKNNLCTVFYIKFQWCKLSGKTPRYSQAPHAVFHPYVYAAEFPSYAWQGHGLVCVREKTQDHTSMKRGKWGRYVESVKELSNLVDLIINAVFTSLDFVVLG